ncbi:hypothetical protein OM416_20195 [Paenibacillus sp. LS1]|uniref:hypothetical protein n=1 Tax=Paenibacillus sp. LS1 TaxID=2992120 RepID=UPI0022306D5C|nr:hypothetical protein [Paenibacillus sp. LS1]MCW3793918.1 hypothetical protein [Paenibacillus sp. LS1]
MERTRIHTLRKEDVLREEFQKVGLSEILAGINLEVGPNDSPVQLEKKLRSAVQRQVKKHVKNMALEDILDFVKQVSDGPYQIDIHLLAPPDTEREKSIFTLLAIAGKITTEDIIPYHPVQVDLKVFDKTQNAFTLLRKELLDRFHMRHRGLIKNMDEIGCFLFADVYKLISNVIVNNTFHSYALTQSEYLQFKIAEYYYLRSYNENKHIMPDDIFFQQQLQKTMKHYSISLPDMNNMEVLYDTTFTLEDFDGSNTEVPLSKAVKNLVIPRLIKTMSNIREKTKQIMNEHSSYAKAFQMKKNISPATLSMMQENQFRWMYGEVELDNDVDLQKFQTLEMEFTELRTQLGLKQALDHSFRIRKLGRHKAAGLYYPYYKATVIDIDGPSSYAHELGHQLDHTILPGQVLSETINFDPIISMYEHLVEDNVTKLPNNNEFKVKWEKKRSYYFYPSEIFARSFELFLSKSMEISSSFLKKEYTSPEYPLDQDFLNLIQPYFEAMLAIHAEEPMKVAVQ